jgi:GNAT superfamily N-acetyltransferase
MSLESRLFENRLAFLAAHRGNVTRAADFTLVDSSSPEFTTAFAEEATSLDALDRRYSIVRLVPWSRLREADLAGLERSGALTYMQLARPPAPAPLHPDLSIEIVTSPARMDVFTDIQVRGFLEPGESYEEWYAWLGEHNLPNLGRADQRFYIASRAGIPVGITLAVATHAMVGIYAVATLPDQRRVGVSTALLARAVADGLASGAEIITLQVSTDSYAEGFYERLSFVPVFVSPGFVRS